MKKTLAQALIDFVNEHYDGWIDHHIYEGYRGRGQSTETTGIVTDSPDAYLVVLLRYPAAWMSILDGDEELQEAALQFTGFRKDSMGQDTILY